MPAPESSAADTLVIVNPASAGGRARRAAPRVAEFLRGRKARAEFVEATSGDDVERRAADAATGGARCIVALGGDGTLHRVLNGALGSGATFGFFPAGHGNDIAAALGLPADPVAAAALFVRATPRPVDVLRARFASGTTRVFLGVGGAGLDAEAARLANGRYRRWPGASRYVAGALWALARFAPPEFLVRTESEAWRGQALLVAVANARAYGSGVKIAPAARMDDGVAEVIIVQPLPWMRVVEAIPILLRAGPPNWPEIVRLRGRRISLAAEVHTPFAADGEPMGETPLEIEVLPGAAHIRAPG